jgi:hypothetical protein
VIYPVGLKLSEEHLAPDRIARDLVKELRCRFGCDNPIGIFYLPEGCACWDDPVQALCLQHYSKAEPIAGMRCIVDLRIHQVD